MHKKITNIMHPRVMLTLKLYQQPKFQDNVFLILIFKGLFKRI